MKKLCIALVSALALGIVNAEETDLVVVGSGGGNRTTKTNQKVTTTSSFISTFIDTSNS